MAIGIVSGALFSCAWFLLIDAAIKAGQQDSSVEFIYFVPSIFSLLGWVAINFTTPTSFQDANATQMDPREVGFFVVGWILEFASTMGALVLCGTQYVGMSTKASAFPGVACVMQTCLIALSAATYWASKVNTTVSVTHGGSPAGDDGGAEVW